MVSDHKDDDLSDSERGRFASKLQELKQKGSSLLVVGNVPDAAAVKACHWMLGDDTFTDRRRLFISTDSDLPTISDRISTAPDQLNPETTKLISWTASSRGAATTMPSQPPQPPYDEISPVYIDSDQLGKLGIAISEEIEAFEKIAGGLSPAELRVCFDSLMALSTEYEHGEVFRFLHVLTGRIRSVQGMAHFHFPVAFNSESAQQFIPLFDATIELRVKDSQPQQRWHLRDEDITSGWLTPSASWDY